MKPVEPVGPGFVAMARRKLKNRTVEEDEKVEEALMEAQVEDTDDIEEEPESKKLLKSNPSDWKVNKNLYIYLFSLNSRHTLSMYIYISFFLFYV